MVSAHAEEPAGELAQELKGVKFDQYAVAPGYSEGPTWKNGEVFFCSGALLRIDAEKKVHRPETGTGRITVLNPDANVLAYLPLPSKVVSNITFGGPNHDEIFVRRAIRPACSTPRSASRAIEAIRARPFPSLGI